MPPPTTQPQVTVPPTRTPPNPAEVPHASATGSFWRGALLGLPAINVVFLGAVTLLANDLFLPAALLVFLGEIPLLLLWARTYDIGLFRALGAVLASSLITQAGLIAILLVTVAIACSGDAQCFS